jgi:hypothetical protein
VIGRHVVMTTIATPLAGAHGYPAFADALREQDDRVIE